MEREMEKYRGEYIRKSKEREEDVGKGRVEDMVQSK